jgi:hypothetical protein
VHERDLLLHLLGHVEGVVGKLVQRLLDLPVDGGELAEETVPASRGLRGIELDKWRNRWSLVAVIVEEEWGGGGGGGGGRGEF